MGKAFLFRESETNQDQVSTFPLDPTVFFFFIRNYDVIIEQSDIKGVSIPPGSSIEVGKLLLRDLARKQWAIFIETLKPANPESGTSGIIRKVSGSFGKFTSASRRALQVSAKFSVQKFRLQK